LSAGRLALAVLGGVAVGVGIGVTLHARRPPAPAVGSGLLVAGPALETSADWCAPGYEPLGAGCLALPASRGPSQPLLVYLHGRYARGETHEEVDRQRRLGARAVARGVPVLALRGRLGGCQGPELAGWYCWPSNERTAVEAGGVVDGWKGTMVEAERRAHTHGRVVLGFSNGGYFAALLATRGLFDADAFVIAHGGPVEPVRAARSTPPLLLLSADDDVAQDDMLALDTELTRERWPHDSYARGGTHGLADEDIDAALAFFARTRSGERLPLEPPLPLHRPEHHAHELPTAATSAPSGTIDAVVAERPERPEDEAPVIPEGEVP
jgi:predicted esterase